MGFFSRGLAGLDDPSVSYPLSVGIFNATGLSVPIITVNVAGHSRFQRQFQLFARVLHVPWTPCPPDRCSIFVSIFEHCPALAFQEHNVVFRCVESFSTCLTPLQAINYRTWMLLALSLISPRTKCTRRCDFPAIHPMSYSSARQRLCTWVELGTFRKSSNRSAMRSLPSLEPFRCKGSYIGSIDESHSWKRRWRTRYIRSSGGIVAAVLGLVSESRVDEIQGGSNPKRWARCVWRSVLEV